jgi:hypothetical protein
MEWCNVLDDIAPSYRALVEENFFATFPDEERRDLDERFDKLLRYTASAMHSLLHFSP